MPTRPAVEIGHNTVIAYHLVWVAYGWWLPNDPRGSMSRCVASDVIAELGALHYGRKRVQPASLDIRAFYERAAEVLKFPLLTFSVEEIRAIADAFASVISRLCYTCYACAIMPDHVHLLIRKHRDAAEEMIFNLQLESMRRVCDLETRACDHPVWGGPGWKVFLDSKTNIERTIDYIEQNPIKAGLAPQQWAFVTPYDGWPAYKRS